MSLSTKDRGIDKFHLLANLGLRFLLILAGEAVHLSPASAEAMVPAPDEARQIKSCEQRLCTMILNKNPAAQDLQCQMTKTWAQQTLKGGEEKSVKWGFGDARCHVDLKLAGADITAALTKPEYTFNIPPQAVSCQVDRSGETKPVSATLAPKIVFKNGHAEKVWINLKDLKGPADIKGTIWTAVKLEDTLGIFHGKMIKSINKFMYTRCVELYSPAALAARKLKVQKRKADAAAATSGQAPEAAAAPKSDTPIAPALPAALPPAPQPN